MANTESEKNSSGKNNNNNNRTLYLLNILFLCAVTVISLTTAVIMFYRMRDMSGKMTAMAEAQSQKEDGDDDKIDGRWYTDAQIEKVKADARAGERSSILLDIQSSFESGKSTTAMLRDLYPGDLVIVNNGSYYFFPIQKNLAMNSFQESDFTPDENGEITYVGTDPSVSVNRGIDISSVNGEIDWQKVSEDKMAFAMVRAAYWDQDGNLTKDERFDENMSGALGAGISAGCYVDLEAEDPESSREAADFVLENLNVSSKEMGMPVAVRVQIPGQGNNISISTKEEWTENVIAFCQVISDAGYEPIIYANTAAFHLLLNLQELEDYDKWISDYSSYLYFPYKFRCWQYSTSGKVDGITGDVSLDISVTQ